MIPARPTFTVVVPSHAAGAKLTATVASVLAQASTPDAACELIVVDDAAADAPTVAALAAAAADARVTVVSEPDGGVYDAMNKGLRLARGRYLLFLGAGDTLRPGALGAAADALRGEDVDLLHGDVWLEREGRRAGGPLTASDFRRKRNAPHQAIFYRADLLARCGGYDLAYPIRADNVLNMRLWADPAVRKRYLPCVVASYEGGGLSDTRVDAAFERDFGRLVRRLFGWGHYAAYCVASVKYRWVAAGAKRRAREKGSTPPAKTL